MVMTVTMMTAQEQAVIRSGELMASVANSCKRVYMCMHNYATLANNIAYACAYGQHVYERVRLRIRIYCIH